MNQIDRINRKIKRLEEEKAAIQEACSHPKVKRVGRGDSGNILTGRDPSSWYECECKLCQKKWSEPQ